MRLISALKYKNYQFFITGQALSNIGNMMHQVAVSWLAYKLTDSAFVLGVVTFSKQFAAFLSGFLAGVVADRFDKKLILQYSNALIGISSLILAILVNMGAATVPLLILLQLIMGLLKGLEIPSRQAFVNDIIDDKSLLTNAIALNSTVFNTARVVGPAFAGLIIPFAGEEICFLLYGIMSAGIVFFFLFIKTETKSGKDTKFNFRAEFFEGANYAFSFPPIKVSLLFVGAFTLVGVSFMVLLPVLVGDVFGEGSQVYGYMTSALGLGAILGGVFLASRTNASGIQNLIFIAACIFSTGLLVASFSSILSLTFIAIALTGLGRVVVFAGTNTLLQTIADEDKRGRVLSLYITIFMGGITLGGILIGAIADWIGVINTLLIEGILCLVVCTIYSTQLKTISSDSFKSYDPSHQ